MSFLADLHLHSHYSRATARNLDIASIAAWALRKGISLVGTGDFTHPAWFSEIEQNLLVDESGAMPLTPALEKAVGEDLPPSITQSVRFVLSAEISTIYKRQGRTRKVHHVVLAPDLPTASRITRKLERIGNLHSDGRPILGLDSRDLMEIVLEAGDDATLIPAHIWTPWFSMLGSRSGFDSVRDCYGDLADHVLAVETGLSSDPHMNWKVSFLDRYRLVSSSDAHSPGFLGREATIFDGPVTYHRILHALRTGDGYVGTLEMFPEEGKYHHDGHRKCGVKVDPGETRDHDGICPSCGKPLTLGVLHRVEQLCDRTDGSRPDTAGDVVHLVALKEVLSELLHVGPKSKRVQREYDRLLVALGPEIEILRQVPLEDVRQKGPTLLAEALLRLREGRVLREAGFDGEFGVIRLFAPGELD